MIRAGLGAAGVEPGTADFEQFLIAAQTTVDSADPINYGAITTATNAVMLQEVIGDTVIPNFVATAPLAGTEPLINVMGLNYISETTVDPGGIRGFNRILNASHGSLLDPTANLEATVEMQGEAVSMAASDGVNVVVTNPQVIAPPQ